MTDGWTTESQILSKPGSWVIYFHEMGPKALAIYDGGEEGQLEAYKAAVEKWHSMGHVCFWPYGADLREAVEDWEARHQQGRQNGSGD